MAKQAVRGTDIYVVEDDADVRRVLTLLLSRAGYHVGCFADGPSLLDGIRWKLPACILLDIYLPGLSGIEILERLRDNGIPAPVVVVSGNQDIRKVVEALKLGALDYVEKPFSGEELLMRVEAAIRVSSTTEEPLEIPTHLPGSGKLTRREREVLEHTVQGKSARQSAAALGLSPRTIESHRAKLLRKTGARNLPELVLKVVTARPKGSD